MSPTTKINTKIRSLNGHRILDLTKSVADNLKQEIAAPVVAELSSSPDGEDNQTGLDNFGQAESGTDATDKKDKMVPSTGGDQLGGSDGPQTEAEFTDETETDDRSTGLIYARVSSDGQLENTSDGSDETDGLRSESPDEGSIQGQISQLKQVADDNGITLPYDPITDEAETGTNFDRDGIEQVFKLSKQKNIDYLLVEKIDRIGRSAPETLYFIWLLQNKCGVTLYTLSGKHDVDEIEGLMQTTLYALIAEVENDIRTTKATNERIRGFLEKKNWTCRSPIIPLGYSETDDGWLEVDPDEKPIIRELFDKFVKCRTYSKTEEHIEAKFGNGTLDGHQVKTILQHSCYIGRPKVPEEWVEDTQFDNQLEEPRLNVLSADVDDNHDVSEETFHEAQRIIEEKEPDTDPDDVPYTVSDFVNEFGLFAVVNSSDPVKLVHHCGEPMVKNGRVDLGGKFDITTHRYKCQNCDETIDAEEYYGENCDETDNTKGYYGKWPTQDEAEKMELIHQALSDEADVFDTDAEGSTSSEPDESNAG